MKKRRLIWLGVVVLFLIYTVVLNGFWRASNFRMSLEWLDSFTVKLPEAIVISLFLIFGDRLFVWLGVASLPNQPLSNQMKARDILKYFGFYAVLMIWAAVSYFVVFRAISEMISRPECFSVYCSSFYVK